MNFGGEMIARFVSGLGLALALCGLALAQDARIADFAGQWVGKVTVETMGPTDFPNSVRDAGVTVTPTAKGGFSLEWATVKRERGDAERPDETTQDTKVEFFAVGDGKRWRAKGGDPEKGKPYWYARLDGVTLTVSGFALLPDGKAELQTYQRTLENGAMGLSYTRILDGMPVRRASGALTKYAP